MELATLAIECEPRLAPVVAMWVQMTPWQRRVTTLEELIEPTTLTPGEFLAAVVRASFAFTDTITDLLVASALPEVVTRSVRRALTLNGVDDRRLLLEHAGFLSGPAPAGLARSGSTVASPNAGPTSDAPLVA